MKSSDSQARRRFAGDVLVLASHNQGKLRELRAALDPLGVEVRLASEAGLAAPDETGTTFEENAVLKARVACAATGLPALADDSGLAVDGLGGAPGIYSARWAGRDGDHAPAIARVLKGLEGMPGRSARFVCVLALAWPDGHTETSRGEAEGTIADAPRGQGGFGYDPIFLPDGGTRTYAELTPEEKRADNHRARALSGMLRDVFGAPGAET